MTLEEVENCEQCYIVYEHEDGASHLFKRLRTDEDSILFERKISGWFNSCPYLSKDLYGIVWFAFAEKPRKCVIDHFRVKIRNYVRTNMPWLMAR